jgi:hypothetical protein
VYDVKIVKQLTVEDDSLIAINHLHERLLPVIFQISSSQGYNKQQIHGRIKNPTLKRILVIDDDDDINLVSKVG